MNDADAAGRAKAEAPRFNLIDEPWIPVLRLDGKRCEVGIREALLGAAEIAEIQDASPLVVAALHRLLLAVLYRALDGPTDAEQAKTLLRLGLPLDQVGAYLDRWRPRFDMFDPLYPFGQNPNVLAAKTESWTKLTAEYNGPSSKVLFDHTDVRRPGTRTPPECARWIVATLNFSVSGGRAYFPSPSANSMMCLVQGKSLFATLLFNLVPYPNRFAQGADTAIWERDPPKLPLTTASRDVSGFADLYTWPARFISLEADAAEQVYRVRFMPAFSVGTGENKSSAGRQRIRDPLVPYRADAKRGLLPLRFEPNREVWRGFDSLLPDPSGYSPMVLNHAASLLRGNARALRGLLVLGQRYEPPNADIDFWKIEAFVLPGPDVDPMLTKAILQRLLQRAQTVSMSLEGVMKSAARFILARTGRELKEDKFVTGKWVAGDISNFLAKRARDGDPAALAVYWSMLEREFHIALSELATATDLSLDDEDRIERTWLSAVKRAATASWSAFVETNRSSGGSDLRAFARTAQAVEDLLTSLQRDITKLDTEKEQA